MRKYLKLNKQFKSLPEIKIFAKKKISSKTWNWLENGTENGNTLNANLNAFQKYKLIPRVLKYKNDQIKKTKFLNINLKMPLVIAPMGHLTQFHKNGEAEVALGAEKFSTIVVISSLTRLNLDEIRKYSKKSDIIYQIYFFNNKNWVEKEIIRAKKINVKAVTVTIDSPVASVKYPTLLDKYDARKFGRRTNFYNLNKKPYFPNWNDIKWLKQKLGKTPLILKGIMHPEDAIKAFKHGAYSVWISNHGGRAFESNVSSLEALQNIRKKVGKNKHLIFDGGVRTGSDLVKALDAGANLIAVGRPIIYGLISGGSEGILQTLNLFYKEFKSSKILSGY